MHINSKCLQVHQDILTRGLQKICLSGLAALNQSPETSQIALKTYLYENKLNFYSGNTWSSYLKILFSLDSQWRKQEDFWVQIFTHGCLHFTIGVTFTTSVNMLALWIVVELGKEFCCVDTYPVPLEMRHPHKAGGCGTDLLEQKYWNRSRRSRNSPGGPNGMHWGSWNSLQFAYRRIYLGFLVWTERATGLTESGC